MGRMRLDWAIATAAGVAISVAGAQQAFQAPDQLDAPDAETVLKRTREHLLPDLERLPRYTCVQTITRRYYRAPGGGPRACMRLIEDHERRKGPLPLNSWDRLRLEVGIAEGQNVYSWLGAAKFETGNIEELAGRGPLGTGDFGSFLESVFRRATISFHEARDQGGRRLFEYSYDMPRARSSYMVKSSQGWTSTAYSGSFLLDPVASDVVSLTVRTAELPERNPACQAISEVEYGRTQIHDRMILIPQNTRLNVIDREGSETVNETAYQSCREFASKSRILETEPGNAPPVELPPTTVSTLSPDLSFKCRFVTPIDSDTAAAGDPIEAVLRSPIHDKRNNLLIPAGARLHGRLTMVQHRAAAFNSVLISVEWESIVVKGRDVSLSATPDAMKLYTETAVVPDQQSPGRRIVVFRKDHLQLRDWEWSWTTQAKAAGSELPKTSRNVSTSPFTIEIADSEFPIEAASGVRFKFTVPAGASSVFLEGTFTANGGGSNDVNVAVFSSDEFAKMENQEPAQALYESGRTRHADLNVSLPPEAGTYYLVFSNNFPLSTPKVVQANLRLHYQR